MRTAKRKSVRLILALLLVAQFGYLTNRVQAEGFVDDAFQSQWSATDQAVAIGKVSRTYFWGPTAFAHTNEMYNESPNNGQRRVQYFDKARMELTKREGQDPNFVTNGLLTVELVTGRLQVGDNKFLQREPATNRVAGDQIGNERTPTYAAFNKNKVIFGLPGAPSSGDRTGQAIKEAINSEGQISTLVRTPVALQYARFFPQTAHNLASVFHDFFRTEPLSEKNWLSVMGYPISEPFWAKDQVMVAGQPREVLIQLFERRALTYTPSNPAGFQVEMGNIGQHYYAWRYNVNSELPGNYRLVYPDGKTILSKSIANPKDNLRIGDMDSSISYFWELGDNLIVVAANENRSVSLMNLSTKTVKKIELPANLVSPRVGNALWSSQSRQLALTLDTGAIRTIQVYQLDDKLNIVDSFTAVNNPALHLSTFIMSADGRYLAGLESRYDVQVSERFDELYLHIVNLRNQTINRQKIAITSEQPARLSWLGNSNQLLLGVSKFQHWIAENNTVVKEPGKIFKVDAATTTVTKILEDTNLVNILLSPDAHYIATVSTEQEVYDGAELITGTINMRSLANPSKDLLPGFTRGVQGRYNSLPAVTRWSADGTSFAVKSGSYGSFASESYFTLLSAVTGNVIREDVGGHFSTFSAKAYDLAAAYNLLTFAYESNADRTVLKATLLIENFDGSDKQIIYNSTSDIRWLSRVIQVTQ